MQSCTSVRGYTASIASGNPFSPSTQAMKISFTPRFCSAGRRESAAYQERINLASWPGGESSARSETDADTDFRRRHEVAGKDRERVRTAHGNYSQRESEQAQRVWQASQDPGSGKPNRNSL